MGTLKEDIKVQSEWIVKAFASEGYNLNYSIKSTMEIDKFFFNNMKNGRPKKGGHLAKKGFGTVLFSIGSYMGETIIKNVPGAEWITDDQDPNSEIHLSMKLPDGTIMWPMQKVMKRFKNGSGDSIYPYIHYATQNHINEKFDKTFWEIEKKTTKAWWEFW